MEQRKPKIEILNDTGTSGTLFGTGLVVVEDDASRWLAWEGAKEAWLANLGSKRTRETYNIAVRQFFEWAGVAPWEVGSALAEQWKAWMRREGKVVSRRQDGMEERGPLSDATVNVKLAALSSLYSYAQRYSTITADGRVHYLWPMDRANPFQVVDRPQVPQFGRAEFPTTEEMMSILGAINTECLMGKRDHALLYTYVVTCKRFSEIVDIQWGDLWEMADGDYGFRFAYKGEKGQGKTRKGVIPRACFRVICEYLRADGRPPETMAAEDYLFVPIYPDRAQRIPGMAGVALDPNRPISNGTANGILKKYARRAGVDEKKAHVHALRHAGARRRAERMKAETGHVDYGVIQDVLGHAQIQTSMIYSKNVLEDPEDPGGKAAAEDWLVTRERRRKGGTAGEEQMEMDL